MTPSSLQPRHRAPTQPAAPSGTNSSVTRRSGLSVPDPLTLEALMRLTVRGLSVVASRGTDSTCLLEDVSLEVPFGQVTTLVGRSGSGKSLLLRSLLGLLPLTPGIVRGALWIQRRGMPPQNLLEGLEQAVSQTPHGWRVDPGWRRQWHGSLSRFWGKTFAYLPQHCARALDPTRTIGAQLEEALLCREAAARAPGGELKTTGPEQALALVPGLIRSLRSLQGRWQLARATRSARRDEALHWLERLGFSEPQAIYACYPAELSGGMARRALLAMVLSGGARVLFADEPTNGLDADSRDRLLEMLEALLASSRLETLLLVTHDFSLPTRLGGQCVVIERGRIQEATRIQVSGTSRQLTWTSPSGRALWEGQRRLEVLAEEQRIRREGRAGALPEGLDRSPGAAAAGTAAPSGLGTPVLRVRDLRFSRQTRGGGHPLEVLRGIDLDLVAGQVVGIQGTNGAGKSTLARCLVGLEAPSSGTLELEGARLPWSRRRRPTGHAHRVQMVFQHPHAALLPEARVEEALLETARILLKLPEGAARAAVAQSLQAVGLQERARAWGTELSGGELKRVALARALLVSPTVLVVDEPTEHVDAPMRAQLLELLLSAARTARHTAILLISHDPWILEAACDRRLLLNHGKLIPLEES